MKKIILTLTLVLLTQVNADNWQIKNLNFITENDGDIGNDQAYTYGSKISVLFLREDIKESFLHIPFTDYQVADNYISFAYAHQMYTPGDLEDANLIPDDRPYAGYMYFETALYQSSYYTLSSLVFQVGLVGPSTQMESVQKAIHSIIGSPDPKGWEHQLNDELTLQINYNSKTYMELDKIFDIESVLIPEYGFDLGNASTKLYAGALFRYGWDIPKNYGSYAIDNANYSKVPLKKDQKFKKEFAFCFNLGARANIIGQNIFLDGNTNTHSHSVEKKNFTLNVIYGFTLVYDQLSFDYIRTHTSKEFDLQKELYSYGSFQLSYNF